jgi:hypothetical protein
LSASLQQGPQMSRKRNMSTFSTGLDFSGDIQHKGGLLDANWTVTGAVNPLDPPDAYVVAPGDAD